MKKLDFIQKLINFGISVMPLHHRSKEPMLPMWRHLQDRLPTHTEYLDWFRTDWNNYGVIAGWGNLVIIDFDNMEYFSLWQLWLRSSPYEFAIDEAFKVLTRKGIHVYLTTYQPAANDKRISIKGGIDVQAQGKYVVGPLSTHPSGSIYQPIGDFFFPCVPDIESILPLHLFPRVAHDHVSFNGAPIPFATNNTEYIDPLTFASMDLISKVKASVRIESLFTGTQRSSTDGRWLKALCPFHQDKHQSAWIDTWEQFAGCQVCGMKRMDVINVYARMHNLSDSAAVRAMAEEIGVWR